MPVLAEKKISLSSYVNTLLDSMITISDNESYNELVRTVGQGSFAEKIAGKDLYSNQMLNLLLAQKGGIKFLQVSPQALSLEIRPGRQTAISMMRRLYMEKRQIM